MTSLSARPPLSPYDIYLCALLLSSSSSFKIIMNYWIFLVQFCPFLYLKTQIIFGREIIQIIILKEYSIRLAAMKYLVITGGVVSGLGKGITISSIGRILKSSGLSVTAIKIDPYLNGKTDETLTLYKLINLIGLLTITKWMLGQCRHSSTARLLYLMVFIQHNTTLRLEYDCSYYILIIKMAAKPIWI